MSYLNEMATALKHATGRTLFHIAFDWLQVHDHVAEELAVQLEEQQGRLDSQNEKLRTLANQLDAQKERIAKLESRGTWSEELFGVRK